MKEAEPMYRCTLYLPKGMIIIDNDGMIEVVTGDHKLTSDEFAISAGIAQLLSRLRNGKVVEFKLQPDSFSNPNQVIKAEWLKKSGNLRHRGNTEKLYCYVETYQEAMIAKGVFTCTQELYNTLPKKRVYIDSAGIISEADISEALNVDA